MNECIDIGNHDLLRVKPLISRRVMWPARAHERHEFAAEQCTVEKGKRAAEEGSAFFVIGRRQEREQKKTLRIVCEQFRKAPLVTYRLFRSAATRCALRQFNLVLSPTADVPMLRSPLQGKPGIIPLPPFVGPCAQIERAKLSG